jgi:hypothetical protein
MRNAKGMKANKLNVKGSGTARPGRKIADVIGIRTGSAGASKGFTLPRLTKINGIDRSAYRVSEHDRQLPVIQWTKQVNAISGESVWNDAARNIGITNVESSGFRCDIDATDIAALIQGKPAPIKAAPSPK